MNRQEKDILLSLNNKPYINQRELSNDTNYSIGLINKSLKNLINEGYLDNNYNLKDKAISILKEYKPSSAIILAAGYGMRMVPINTEVPKALLKVKDEVLIERIIKHLHEVNITNIYVVVGYMKEEFDYLIDDYDVKLIYNKFYKDRNNLHSLNLVSKYLNNTYIIPSNIYCMENPFNENELYSYYLVSDKYSEDSDVKVNRKNELVISDGGNSKVGIAYISKDDVSSLALNLSKLDNNKKNNDYLWEKALINDDKYIIQAKEVNSNNYVEINTYEELREFDKSSNQLKNDAIDTIKKVFKIKDKDIKDITILKKGMTNRSFVFSVDGNRYIMRIPGEGTDLLINRKNEAEVYKKISGLGICDDPIYINPDNGYKITKYLDDARVGDPYNEDDLKKCMELLRKFHSLKLKVNHEFNLFKEIDFYESLFNHRSIYKDYSKTKENVYSLKEFIDQNKKEYFLTHIDAQGDNFLFYKDGLQLTDFEYSGMQDSDVDIAMFCIYSLYSKEESDKLIDIYYENNCDKLTRIKIYAYMAVCGLLWSNWCEYKRALGVEFGEYSLRQYRYAKDYYKIVKKELECIK